MGLGAPFRQGRSLSLPTLPYQRTNRYAVDGAKLVFHLLLFRIGYTNRYYVVSVIPTFVLLRLCIDYTNRYGVDGVMPAFVLLCPRICYTNHPVVVGTTPLICAWAVKSCLLSQIIYIIRCVAVRKEMVFVGRTSNTKQG